MNFFKKLIWEFRKSNETAWKRQSPLKELSDYMSLDKCKAYMKITAESIQADVEDLKFDERVITLTYFKAGKKYHYSLVPVMLELNSGNDYFVVRAEYIYSP